MSGWFAEEKWPRVYAAEIMSEPSKEKRREMFKEVPAHLQDIVWAHCLTASRGSNGKS